jgi:hypothetical protein
VPTTYFKSEIAGKKIPDEELWQRTKQTPIEQQITERKWRWIGYILRKPQDAI